MKHILGHYRALQFALLLSIGCRPHLNKQVTEPADVSIHPRVTKITLINRAENPQTSAIRNGFVQQSQQSKMIRYAISDGQQIFNNLAVPLNGPVPKSSLAELCETAKVNGVLVLNRHNHSSESDSDYQDRVFTDENGAERTERVYTASYSSQIDVKWSFRGCNGQTYDSHETSVSERWSAEGDTPGDARSALGDEQQLSVQLASTLGTQYFRRISPYEVTLTRIPFTGCGGGFKEGLTALKESRWKAAYNVYNEMLPDLKGSKRGKALYNMAIAKEMLGELDSSLKLAKRANRILSSKKSAALIKDIQRRKSSEDRLESQMRQAEQDNPQVNE